MTAPRICRHCGSYIEPQTQEPIGRLALSPRGAVWNGSLVYLPPAKRLILAALVQAHGEPVRLEALTNILECDETRPNTVRVHVSQLRQAFGPDGLEIIKHVRGGGFYIDLEFCGAEA